MFLFAVLFTRTAQAACLVDEPKQIGQYKYPEQLPGQLYNADTQCKWQFGSKARLCSLDFVKVGYLLYYYYMIFTQKILSISSIVSVYVYISKLSLFSFVDIKVKNEECFNIILNSI